MYDVSYRSGFWRKKTRIKKREREREKKEDHHNQQGKERKGTLCIVFSQEKKSKDYKQTHSK